MTKTDLIAGLRARQRELTQELRGVEAAITAMTSATTLKRVVTNPHKFRAVHSRQCEHCKQPFKSKRPNTRYCSKKCTQQSYKKGTVIVEGAKK